jgi:pfkB family carbohydrate kinase
MIRYTAIGHITKDIVANGWVFGGAVTFSARAARALGCDVSVVTSCERGLDLISVLPDVAIVYQPSDRTTTFENIYMSNGRVQRLHAISDKLKIDLAQSLPRPIDIVHLAPVAQEVDPAWIDQFDGALIGVTPQGWLRQWDSAGRVKPIEWANAAEILRRAAATIISIEDIGGDESIAQQWAAIAPVLVVTRGKAGCTVFSAGQPIDLAAPAVNAIDTTGAGDIFAAAFFVQLRRTHDPIAAGRFAVCLAAQSTTRVGIDGVPTRTEIEQCLAATQ